MRILLPFLLLTLLGGCKIEVTAPPEGAVVSVDGSFRCEAGEVCAIEVADLIFNETFIAEPGPGYVFSQWHRRHRGLCGGSLRVCHLRTSGFSGNDALMALLQGDEWFYLSPEFAVSGPDMTPIADALLRVVDPDLRSCLQSATVGLNYAEELGRLACTGSRRGMQITNLQGLEQFSQLSWLNLSGNPLAGIEPLNFLKNLVSLQLRDTGLSNIDSLASLGDLVVLDLQQNALSDIGPLSKLTRLSRLQLSFNPLTRLDPLAQVDNLRELHLRGVPVTDITALAASHTWLRELDLTDTAIRNLSIVEQLPALEQLSIGSAALENVNAVATAQLLQSLTVRIAPEMDAAVRP